MSNQLIKLCSLEIENLCFEFVERSRICVPNLFGRRVGISVNHPRQIWYLFVFVLCFSILFCVSRSLNPTNLIIN